MIEFCTSFRRMGATLPGMDKWAMRVYEEILNIAFSSGRPSVLALTARDRSDVPKPTKYSPMLELELLLDLARLSIGGKTVRHALLPNRVPIDGVCIAKIFGCECRI